MRGGIKHEIRLPERRQKPVKRKVTTDDVIDVLIAISIITRRLAKRLMEQKEGKENE